MNTRAFTLALFIAGFAMFLVYTYIEDRESQMFKVYGDPQTVVVAKTDIRRLELIDDSKLSLITVPKKFAQPGYFVSIDKLENTVASVPIRKGEQITETRVTRAGAETGLSRQVSSGKRAFALTITDDSAASKLIKPGDYVDIIASIDYSSGRKDMQKTMTVLQNVPVLSTGLSLTKSIPIYGIKTPREIKAMKVPTYTRYNTITLELHPYEVQKLTYILNFGGRKPYLSLRNNNDTQIVDIKPTRIYDVLGDEAAEAKAFFARKYKEGQ